ncbi:MAG: uroporphyrin-III C-methyltransferase/precorrin-2 dehydrogenase/sirohydrochlorin ferrochelatase [Candidatus Azotimanducaceae bacterium]|jgi:uroporphyrin-III C-methyltransferase/precorrin-2 dehydrogenase/sirohydrochlorin ferrochelatase
MKQLPIFLTIRHKACLVVGAGSIAARKIGLLLKAGADVSVVASEIGSEVSELEKQGAIRCLLRNYEPTDLKGIKLVIAATNNAQLNADISIMAQAENILVNVVDNPELCSFLMPSIIDRNPIQIAISTGGASPVLARLIRSKLEASIPSAYGELAKLVENYRTKVKQAFANVDLRRRFWESVLEGPVSEFALSGRMNEAETMLSELIQSADPDPKYQGEVYLVGAGPGDPDLLTFKALRLMQKCDVVVYDRLVSEPIMALVRRDAEKIYAGKASANHSISQENINQLLVRLAKQGKRVLRLKGGDPFVFGRGGEEIGELIEDDIEFQVVPGITAASGCTTYAGIPLTHRDHSQACIFVTGHRKVDGDDLNWAMLSHANQTVVFYMGLDNVQRICDALKKHGRHENTPAALIEKGTTPDQRVLVGDLNTLPDLVKNNNVRAPTLIVVGEVVDLHSQLNWFKPGNKIQ